MINSEYLINLNKAQKEAVLYLDGPLLIQNSVIYLIDHLISKYKLFEHGNK